MIKNEDYKKELKELEQRMIDAEAFAEKLPFFKKQIIKNKFTEDDFHINFGSSFDDIYAHWDITRRTYKAKELTNYVDSFRGTKKLFKVYINSYSFYDLPNNFGIEDYLTTDLFFYKDSLNSSYYVEDKTIEKFMYKFIEWRKNAIELAKDFKKQAKINALKKDLEELERTK